MTAPASVYAGGNFCVVYLSPRDYHRVHAPVEGQVRSLRHVQGTLFPVNDIGLNHVPRLFARNERVVVEQGSVRHGAVATVMVGAIGVGRITLSFDDEMITNDGDDHSERVYAARDAPLLTRGWRARRVSPGLDRDSVHEPSLGPFVRATRGRERTHGRSSDAQARQHAECREQRARMTDELGTRKAGRRRRTTRRLVRRPIRVPGDDVPRQSKVDDDYDNELANEFPGANDPEPEELEVSPDRPSSDLLDVDLEVDGVTAEGGPDGPTSGVVPAPPRISVPAPLSVNMPKAVVMPGNIAMHAPAPATASIPPPAPASVPAPTSVPAPAARDSGPPDEKTNPQIRLAELGRSSRPPPPLAARNQ